MLLYKCQDTVITVNQVGAYKISVIIAVNINLAENEIRAVLRTNLKDKIICPKQHCTCKGYPGFTSFRIGL